ncbi:MAG: filamentous hemagglutinin N-terminal domain-containing protein [Magnetococcales bacterium]|nr:filamentous hemagglutinin N-terminal domain-containing protein [Magnetococcales bacterium]
MNRTCRLAWNTALNALDAAAEGAEDHSRMRPCQPGHKAEKIGVLALAILLASGTSTALAVGAGTLPSGYQVTAGTVHVSTVGTTMTVQESTQRAAVNWQNFSIGSGATVDFQQPNNSAVILNRVVGTEQSVIDGALNANGQVFLLNSNGVLFSKGASVNTGGLVAATLDISDADFMAGKSTFTANGHAASVINLGTLNAAEGGYVALLGNQVSNQGVIAARLGTAILAAGDSVSLNFNGNSLLGVTINQGTLNALVENKQAIYADGGQVVLTAQGVDSVLASAVNNTGEVRAQTIANREGKIYLLGDMQSGTVHVDGTLDASAPNGGDGGFVETSAAHVKVADTARVSTAAAHGLTGSWLLDPNDFNIAASGGDITGLALSTALGAGNVTITTTAGAASCSGATCATGSSGSGNINVYDATNPVTWSAHTLTLSAYNNININVSMTGSGTAGLALLYGQGAVAASNTSTCNVNAPVNLASTGSFSTKLGSDGITKNYTIINSLGIVGDATTAPGTMTLQGMAASTSLAGNYVLGSNIDASGTSTWNSNAGFAPIGSNPTNFTGIFDGLGHTITGLTINRPSENFVGLFGFVGASGVVRNVGLLGGSINGGGSSVGELVGQNIGGTISNSYATGNVTGSGTAVGGLIGYSTGTISNSHATGSVTGVQNTGGLVGQTGGGTLSNSYATGSVSGSSSYIGGLVGQLFGTLSNSYATGSVSGVYYVGGLVGSISSGGTISNSYAVGNVHDSMLNQPPWGISSVGGLVGTNNGTISNSYAMGNVSGSISGGSSDGLYAGGLVGINAGTISNTYATGAVSGSISASVGSNIAVGGLVGGNDGPISNSFYDKTVNPAMAGINGSPDVAGTVWGMSTADMKVQANFVGATAANNPAEGTVNPNWNFTTPVWKIGPSSNNGYPCLAWSASCVSATPVYLDFVTGTSVYGSTPSFAYVYDTSPTYGSGTVVTDASPTGTVSWSGTSGVPTATSNVGTYSLTYSGLTLGNSAYTLANNSVNWSVSQAPLTVTANSTSKTYGQTATLTGFTSVGLKNSDAIDTVTETSTGKVATASVLGGPYAIVPSAATGETFNASNYSITYANGSLTVNPLVVSVATIPSATRVYDGTTSVAANLLRVTNAVNEDSVTLSGQGILAGSAAGSETLSSLAGLSLSNTNYTLNGATRSGSVTVTPRPVSVATIANANRVYDGTTAAAANLLRVTNLIGADSVTLSGMGVLTGSAAGTEVLSSLKGLSLNNSNYTLTNGTVSGSVVVTMPESVVANTVVPVPPPVATPTQSTGSVKSIANVVNSLPQISATFGGNTSLSIVSSPGANEPTQVVSLSEAHSMMQPVTTAGNISGGTSTVQAGDSASDVRVPVSRNSLADIVNGGVKLPAGVEQQLFVVKAN